MSLDKVSTFLFVFVSVFLPPYILPILGTYLSVRLYARHWWPTWPEIQLILLPAIVYGTLSFMKDRQGFSFGLPALLIAVPVMITLWSGPGEKDLWISPGENSIYWIGIGLSTLTAIAVYVLYPKGNLHF